MLRRESIASNVCFTCLYIHLYELNYFNNSYEKKESLESFMYARRVSNMQFDKTLPFAMKKFIAIP